MTGWYYEIGDPSVGLFGGGWVHEDCPHSDAEGFTGDVEEEVVEQHYEDECLIRTWRITCADCGATFTVQDGEWDPDYVEPEPEPCHWCGRPGRQCICP